MQEDPIGDGLNWYGYGENNPLSYVDPSGYISTKMKWFLGTLKEISTDSLRLGPGGLTAGNRAKNKTDRELKRRWPKVIPTDGSWYNAIKHCTWTCNIAQENNSRIEALNITNNHEKYHWDCKNSSMDLWNNKQGLLVFDNKLYGKKTCLEA